MVAAKDRLMEPEPLPPTTAKPTNVIAALHRVMNEIGGIQKLTAAERARRNMGGGDQGVTYAYRGIDQIAAAAQPLFGEYGVVIVPAEILDRTVIEFTLGNPPRPWTETTVTVLWKIYGPGGVDDVITSITEGQGRDNSDKGINKAMTGAFKNLLLRILCIGDPADDTDGHSPGAEPPPDETPLGRRFVTDAEGHQRSASEVLFDRVAAFAGSTVGDELKKLAKDRNRRLVAKGSGSWLDDDEWFKEVDAVVTAAEASPPPAAEPETVTPDDEETPDESPDNDE